MQTNAAGVTELRKRSIILIIVSILSVFRIRIRTDPYHLDGSVSVSVSDDTDPDPGSAKNHEKNVLKNTIYTMKKSIFVTFRIV